MSLPTLAAVLAGHQEIATVPAPGFRGYISDGTQFLVPVVISAVLDRTAVVHPFGHDDERRALRLDAVFVAPQSIRWQPRNRHELKELESRQRARANRRGKDPAAELRELLPAVSEAPRALRAAFSPSADHSILRGQ